MDRVLVVDDDPLVCKTLEEWLQAEGLQTIPVHSGQEAIRTLKQLPLPDLILLDMVLPDISGIALCRSLKSEESTVRIPVVILTGAGSQQDRVRGLDSGADDFVSKPVDRVELMARVRSLLRAKRLSDRLLISYHELDKLGTFAETFASQPVAEWSPGDVALSMAKQLLGPEPGLTGHPTLIWGGTERQGVLIGLLACHRGTELERYPVNIALDELEEALKPYARADGFYLCRSEPSSRICRLLNLPPGYVLTNFVAVAMAGKHIVLVGGYPWDVGMYEMPLLKALVRHWGVFERIRAEARETQEAFFYTLETLAVAAEFYDRMTAVHIRRVASYSGRVAEALGCEPRFVRLLKRSSVTHDVGKATIPMDVLKKAGPLTAEERIAMEGHTVNGAVLLGDAGQLGMARNIARSHHENYDGTGYPDRLNGESIPLEARIIKVVDIYDALRARRAYKPAMSHEEALDIMRAGDNRIQPSHFDPRILQAFLDVHPDIRALFDSNPD